MGVNLILTLMKD